MATTETKEVQVPSIRELLDVKPPSEAVRFLNVLIYGEPGVGKTYFCGTADDDERSGPVLILDVEGGTLTLRHRPNVDVVPVRSMDKLSAVHEELRKHPDHYNTVVIDSLTELQKLDMKTVMDEQYEKKPESTDKFVPDQRAWGKSSERVRRIIRGFKDLDCHTITTCLVAEKKDERTNITSMYPSLPGKLAGEVSGFFDIVGLMTSNDEDDDKGGTVQVRRIQFAKTRRVIAKDRTGALGDLLVNPTVPMILDLVNTQSQLPISQNGKG
jgi:phage nucleotide-binding protein